MSSYFTAAERCGMRKVVPSTPDLCLKRARVADSSTCVPSVEGDALEGSNDAASLSRSRSGNSSVSAAAAPSIVIPADELPLFEKRTGHAAGLQTRREKLLQVELNDHLDYEQRAKVAAIEQGKLQRHLEMLEQKRREEEAEKQQAEQRRLDAIVSEKQALKERLGESFLSGDSTNVVRDNTRHGVESTLATYFEDGGKPEHASLVVIKESGKQF